MIHTNQLCEDSTAYGEGCPIDRCKCLCHFYAVPPAHPCAFVLEQKRRRIDWNIIVIYAAILTFCVAVYMLANWS